ncbi:MAG: hypothetical protein K2M34_02970 [Alphaproteobacteria bacterium]|nr:hypothetical protein [Alphaproteobacteria bacterium]
MTLTINARTIGFALQRARHSTSILSDDVAQLLKISRAELTLFENGEVEIPPHILESLFALGLITMHTRSRIRDYNRMARQWRHMHNRAIDLHNKLQKITDATSPILKQ